MRGQRHALAALYPGKDPVPIVQETGWAPGPVWMGAENLAPPPRFDPRTVQPVASRYTDYATRLTNAGDISNIVTPVLVLSTLLTTVEHGYCPLCNILLRFVSTAEGRLTRISKVPGLVPIGYRLSLDFCGYITLRPH